MVKTRDEALGRDDEGNVRLNQLTAVEIAAMSAGMSAGDIAIVTNTTTGDIEIVTDAGGFDVVSVGNLSSTPAALEAFRTALFSLHSTGIISVQGGTAPQVVAASPAKVTLWNNDGLANGMTPDQANNELIVDDAGKYLVVMPVTLSDGSNEIFTMTLYKRDVSALVDIDTGYSAIRKIGTSSDIGEATIVGIVEMDVGDKFQLFIKSSSGTSVIITEASLFALKLYE